MRAGILLALSLVMATSACQQSATVADTTGQPVDMPWSLHGQDNGEQRHSPLADINDDNISNLGLAWYFDYPTHRGLEATPIIHDGILYSTGSWSMVFAHDAVTGKLLWMYDPKVPKDWAVHLCCDVVNRGVALSGDRVLFGTLDGRLVALDKTSGKPIWDTQTTDRELPYSITGAPRVVGNKVIIGNGGSELGVRGYVSAYDSGDGTLLWRFYTVPGNPDNTPESPAMEHALTTWKGGEWWKYGGGGTVWDAMAYDADLNLLYIGVGNGAPWNRKIRSPGGGDNLYLSSIVALNPDDGSYVWHYQTTPGDTWDYTATQHMILADLELNGRQRKVIMQAPKNGFFYVLDRISGEFISAEAYNTVNWASHIDQATGRPVENPGARYEEGATGVHFPGPSGAHNWHPMSFSPSTGLVYIPAQDVPFIYEDDESFTHQPGFWNTGINAAAAVIPDDPEEQAMLLSLIGGHISAWDPVTQTERWRVNHEGPWNGGVLSTAGNLVFQGNASGELVAYRADNGERLWHFDAQTGIVAPPVTFRQGGEQYLAVLAGWGGSMALFGGKALKGATNPNRSRLLVFKLDGNGELPPAEVPAKLVLNPPPLTASKEEIEQGKKLFAAYCMVCHGDAAVGGHVTPDLRAINEETHKNWQAIVLGGMHWQQGMVGFSKVLDEKEAEAIHQYVIERAHHALTP
ncbi:MAG: PQQ-dependent dehydrogenase, methanol/ethanol family [Halioglobus sp.]